MKHKLLALDMDNTTLSDDGTISEANKKSVKKYIKAGGHVAIVSGRNSSTLKKHTESLGIEDGWNVGLNGMMIFNIAKEEIIPLTTIDREPYEKLIEVIRKKDIATMVFDSTQVYYEKEHNIPIVASNEMKGITKQYDYMDVKGAMKILLWFNGKTDNEYWNNVCETIGLNGTPSANDWYEIVSTKANKYTGLLNLANKLGIKEDEIAAIGDYGNDLVMIKNAHLGVAVKNASEDVKNVANIVLDKTNNEDAVSYLIEEYLLKE